MARGWAAGSRQRRSDIRADLRRGGKKLRSKFDGRKADGGRRKGIIANLWEDERREVDEVDEADEADEADDAPHYEGGRWPARRAATDKAARLTFNPCTRPHHHAVRQQPPYLSSRPPAKQSGIIGVRWERSSVERNSAAATKMRCFKRGGGGGGGRKGGGWGGWERERAPKANEC